jgi:single-strand DNA-binding protein
MNARPRRNTPSRAISGITHRASPWTHNRQLHGYVFQTHSEVMQNVAGSNATNIAVFSLATKTSWKNDAGTWESRTEWHRCVAFGRLAEFAATLTKGAHLAVEGELRSHEYQREVAVGTQTTSIPQRVWEIRLDSVLKLDRAAKGASSDEQPRRGAPLRGISSTDREKVYSQV